MPHSGMIVAFALKTTKALLVGDICKGKRQLFTSVFSMYRYYLNILCIVLGYKLRKILYLQN